MNFLLNQNHVKMREVKQFIVIRTDLEMSMGKTAAQASHASMKIFFDKMSKQFVVICLTPITSLFTISTIPAGTKPDTKRILEWIF